MADFPYLCTACGSGFVDPHELLEHQEGWHTPDVAEGELEQIRRRALHGLAVEEPDPALVFDELHVPTTSAEFSRRVHRLRLLAARAIAATDTATLERIACELERLEELAQTFVAELHEIRREAIGVARTTRWVLQAAEKRTA